MHTPAFTHAGGICLRAGSAGPEVLCVRPSAPGEDVWLLPKGHIEPGEDAPEAGVREVAEEAGALLAAISGSSNKGGYRSPKPMPQNIIEPVCSDVPPRDAPSGLGSQSGPVPPRPVSCVRCPVLFSLKGLRARMCFP